MLLKNRSKFWVVRLLSLSIALVLVASSCSSDTKPEATNFVKKLVVHSSADAVRDPLLAVTPEQRFIVALENSRLFSLSRTGELKADLASSYRVSPDGTKTTIKLSDRTFSDETPITSTDVKATLTRVASAGGELSSLVSSIKGSGEAKSGVDFFGISTPDDKTVEIELSAPNPLIVYHFTHPGTSIVPAKSIDAQGTLTVGVGSGYYTTEDISNEIDVVSKFNPRVSNLPAIELVKKPAKALRETPVDEDVDIVLGDTQKSKSFDRLGVNRLAVASWNIYVAGQDSPLANKKLRQAILVALDQKEAIETYRKRAVLPIKFTGDTFDSIECGNYCETNSDKAKDLVKEVYPDLNVPLITLDIEQNEIQKELAASAQKRLNDAGIPTEIREYDATELSNVIARGQAQLFRFGWLSDVPVGADALVEYFKADSIDNVSGLADADLEESIANYLTSVTLAEKKNASKVMQERIMDLWLMRPIAQFQSTITVNKRLSGATFGLYGVMDIKNLREK